MSVSVPVCAAEHVAYDDAHSCSHSAYCRWERPATNQWRDARVTRGKIKVATTKGKVSGQKKT